MSDNLSLFLTSLPSLQTPEDYARSHGKHEAVKILKEYAEVCGSVVMKGCVWNLDAFLFQSQCFSFSLVLITRSLSLSLLDFPSFCLLVVIHNHFRWTLKSLYVIRISLFTLYSLLEK